MEARAIKLSRSMAPEYSVPTESHVPVQARLAATYSSTNVLRLGTSSNVFKASCDSPKLFQGWKLRRRDQQGALQLCHVVVSLLFGDCHIAPYQKKCPADKGRSLVELAQRLRRERRPYRREMYFTVPELHLVHHANHFPEKPFAVRLTLRLRATRHKTRLKPNAPSSTDCWDRVLNSSNLLSASGERTSAIGRTSSGRSRRNFRVVALPTPTRDFIVLPQQCVPELDGKTLELGEVVTFEGRLELGGRFGG